MMLSIIIPVFNERKTIKAILEKVNLVKVPLNIKKEIIVVDDGSYDGTSQILSREKNINRRTVPLRGIKFKYIRHKKNLGKGASVRDGIESSKGELIIIQDADLEYNPKEYNKLLEPVLNNKAQVVYGTRLINYPLRFFGKNKTILPTHLIANKLLTFLTNVLFGSNLTDMETCYKLFKREILNNISLCSNRFDFEPEITAKILKLNIPIAEVPISVNPRTYKEGKKIRWYDGVWAIFTLIKYKFYD